MLIWAWIKRRRAAKAAASKPVTEEATATSPEVDNQ
jgi:hypothetical protein